MESKGDDVLSNASDALEKDQTLIPTLNQDQEGYGEGKKAKPEADADYDGTIGLLFDEIRALSIEKRELKLLLDDACKEVRRTMDNLTASAAAAFKDFEAEVDRLKRSLKDLEAEKAKLAVANDVLEAEISTLEVRHLAAAKGKEVDDLALADLLEMKVLGLSEDLWHSMEQAEAIVKGLVEIRDAREEVLVQAVKALKETKTRLERELAGILSQIDRQVEIQGEHDAAVAAMASGLKVSRVVVAVASVGALAATAVMVCLRNIRQRFHDYEDMLEDTLEFPRKPDMSYGLYLGVNGGLNMWDNYPEFPTRLKKDEKLGLAEAITSSILSTGRLDLQRKLFCSIQLIGGVAMTGGLVAAVEERVLHAIPSNEAIDTVEVLQSRSDPLFVSWKGGAILAILDFARDAWIHREDWIRNGIHIGSGRKYKDSYFLQAQAMCYINS